MAIFETGMTGAQFLAALNTQITGSGIEGTYNVLKYGAVGDGVTDDTDHIQDAIDAASTDGGTVYVPAGVYMVNTLTCNSKVCLQGDGKKSVLKSRAAEPLLSLQNEDSSEESADRWSLRIKSIKLDGDNTGTIGLNFLRYSVFSFEDLLIYNFEQYGIYGNGFLIGSLTNCYIKNCVIGVYGKRLTEGTDSAPNLVTFINCKIDHNTTLAVKWEYGWLLTFIGCNFEFNGVNGNAATGVIDYSSTQVQTTSYGQGIILNNCWMEYNYGTVIKITNAQNTGGLISSINNCICMLGTPTVAINIISNTGPNKLIVRDSSIMNTASVQLDGANAVLVNDQSNIVGTITQNDSSKYYTVDVTEVT